MNRRNFLISSGAAASSVALFPSFAFSTSYLPSLDKICEGFGEIHVHNVCVEYVHINPEDAINFLNIPVKAGSAAKAVLPSPGRFSSPYYGALPSPRENWVGSLWGADVMTDKMVPRGKVKLISSTWFYDTGKTGLSEPAVFWV